MPGVDWRQRNRPIHALDGAPEEPASLEDASSQCSQNCAPVLVRLLRIVKSLGAPSSPAAGARVGCLFSGQGKLRANISQASTNRRVFGCPILAPAAGARVGFRLLRIVVGARHAVPLRAERCNRRWIERNPHLAAAPAPMVRFLFPVAPAFRPAPPRLPSGHAFRRAASPAISISLQRLQPLKPDELAAFHMNSVATPASCISWSHTSLGPRSSHLPDLWCGSSANPAADLMACAPASANPAASALASATARRRERARRAFQLLCCQGPFHRRSKASGGVHVNPTPIQ